MANEQPNSGQKSSSTPESLEQKTAQVEDVESAFKLRDLSRLTFSLDGAQELDAWSSTAKQFNAFVQTFAKVRNVDTNKWTPFERLDFLNKLWEHCQKNRLRFPFSVKPAKEPLDINEDVRESKKA